MLQCSRRTGKNGGKIRGSKELWQRGCGHYPRDRTARSGMVSARRKQVTSKTQAGWGSNILLGEKSGKEATKWWVETQRGRVSPCSKRGKKGRQCGRRSER